MATVSTGYGKVDRDLYEFIYLLFVKCSTFRVWPSGHTGLPAEEGSLQMFLIRCEEVEPGNLYKQLQFYQELVNPLGMLLTPYSDLTDTAKATKVFKYCQIRQCHISDYEFFELGMQLDLFCSKQENIALDEAEYVKHQIREFWKNNCVIENSRLFLYDWSRQENLTDQYKMAPEGFQRVLMAFSCVVAIFKD